MRFKVGPIPASPEFPAIGGGWLPLREPSLWVAQLSAVPMAVAIVFGFVWAWAFVGGSGWARVAMPTVFELIVPVLIVAVPFHEFVHALFHPRLGLTDATTLGIWPRKVVLYAHYEGELSRRRFVLMLVAPFALLSVAPYLLCAALSVAPPLVVALTIANGAAACVDLLGAALVAFQLPRGSVVRNNGDRTWWRVAA